MERNVRDEEEATVKIGVKKAGQQRVQIKESLPLREACAVVRVAAVGVHLLMTRSRKCDIYIL